MKIATRLLSILNMVRHVRVTVLPTGLPASAFMPGSPAGRVVLPAIAVLIAWLPLHMAEADDTRRTHVTIEGDRFFINGEPTYQGVTWTPQGEDTAYPIEGLLFNARMVQGIFDDLNPRTVDRWVYPDTGKWDPDRNTQGFIDAMASWYEHGLRCVVVNLQGGSPEGYSQQQPWHNSAFTSTGGLRGDYMNRLEQILDRTDELGMVVMVGYFYFGQDHRLEDERAVHLAVMNATRWILNRGYRNVIIEINNECDLLYDHAVLQPQRVHELIELVRRTEHRGHSLLAGTSYRGGRVPDANVVAASDFVLLHGNAVRDPQRMVQMIREVRAMDAYRGQPILNNEDDQPWRVAEQGFGHHGNNFVKCVKHYASWGYFDFRLDNELDDFNQGFQTVPANWQISSPRKRAFFGLLARITDSPGTPYLELQWSDDRTALHVQIENEVVTLEHMQLLFNNEVAAEARRENDAFTFRMDQLPQEKGMARARASYERDGREIMVESPYMWVNDN